MREPLSPTPLHDQPSPPSPTKTGKLPVVAGASRGVLVAQVSSVLLAIVILTLRLQFGDDVMVWLRKHAFKFDQTSVPTMAAPAVATRVVEKATETPTKPKPAPAVVKAAPQPSAAPPVLDQAAIAKAQATLDAVSRDRARADERVASAARLLEQASQQAALQASLSKTLAFRVRDPSAQITRSISRGGYLRAEREKLEKEVIALRRMPRPKATSIVSRTPVARAAYNEEFHFELKNDRVSFINLDGLLKQAKSDAQVRLRLSDRVGVISSKVGPIGGFSLIYALARAVNDPNDLLDRRSLRYDLRGWELVPESNQRGETFEVTRNPISAYSQAIGRLSPASATITLWTYPDSFRIFRKLRDDLTARGFTVAARPLPDGMAIRGSPSGSISAVQ